MSDLFEDAGTDKHRSDGPVPATRRRSNAHRVAAVEKRRKRRRSFLTVVLMLASLILLIAGGWFVVRPTLLAPTEAEMTITDYPGPGEREVEVVIATGSTGTDIAAVLADADVIATERAFIQAFNANPSATSIQPGTFLLRTKMSSADAIAALLDPAYRADLTVTIPEGFTVGQVYARVASVLGLAEEDVRAAARDHEALGLPEQARANPDVLDPLEGWLAASTYTAMPNDTPADVLRQMVDLTQARLTSLGAPEDSWHEILTIASILQAEVSYVEEYPKVARVIENRLAGLGDTGRTLGMDSTVAYGLGIASLEVTREQFDDPSNPYNTRQLPGLPPGPIGAPGVAAIEAALNPAEGDWIYFVTVDLDTGETRFTADYGEHQRNQAEFRAWLAAQPAGDAEDDDS